MPRPLTRDDIRHAIDLSSFNRGLTYYRQGMVIDLAEERRDAEGVTLQARVRGSGGRIYRQSIFIPADPERRDITGSCGCPVGYNCKHVAAACLAFEERERQSQPTDGTAATEFLKRWLNRVVQAGQDKAVDAEAERLVYVLQPSPNDAHGVAVELRVAKPLRRGVGSRRAGRPISSTSCTAIPPPVIWSRRTRTSWECCAPWPAGSGSPASR